MAAHRILEWKLSGSSNQRAIVAIPLSTGRECARPVGFWLHSAVGTPEALLPEALAHVESGAICVLPEATYSRARLGVAARGPDNSGAEARLWRQNAWEHSLLLDRLQSEFPIDLERSFAVGFNLGGSQIARWLKDDTRIRRAVIAGAVPELSRFWLESVHPLAAKARKTWPDTIKGYSERTRELDLLESVAELGGARLLFQFGLRDEWIDSRSVGQLTKKLRARHKIEWLNDDHEMQARLTQRHRRDWIQQRTEILPQRTQDAGRG